MIVKMKESDILIISVLAMSFLPSLFSYLSKRSSRPNAVWLSGLVLTSLTLFLVWTL